MGPSCGANSPVSDTSTLSTEVKLPHAAQGVAKPRQHRVNNKQMGQWDDKTHPRTKNCPFKNKKCRKCRNSGHFAVLNSHVGWNEYYKGRWASIGTFFLPHHLQDGVVQTSLWHAVDNNWPQFRQFPIEYDFFYITTSPLNPEACITGTDELQSSTTTINRFQPCIAHARTSDQKHISITEEGLHW